MFSICRRRCNCSYFAYEKYIPDHMHNCHIPDYLCIGINKGEHDPRNYPAANYYKRIKYIKRGKHINVQQAEYQGGYKYGFKFRTPGPYDHKNMPPENYFFC